VGKEGYEPPLFPMSMGGTLLGGESLVKGEKKKGHVSSPSHTGGKERLGSMTSVLHNLEAIMGGGVKGAGGGVLLINFHFLCEQKKRRSFQSTTTSRRRRGERGYNSFLTFSFA